MKFCRLFLISAVLDEAYLLEVFTRNAPVDPAVWAFTQALGLDPSLQATLEGLQFGTNTLSPREALGSQLTMAHNELGLLLNEKIRRFLNDSAGLAYDSISAIYLLDELPNSAFKVVDLALSTGHFSEAGTMISLLNEDPANEDICFVLGQVKQLKEDTTYFETMRDSESTYLALKNKLGSNNPLLDTYARGLLEGVYDEKETEITLQPLNVEEESARKGTMTEAQNITGSLSNKTIRIYPNPASRQLTVETGGEHLQVEILDLSGKLFLKQSCEKTCVLDLSALINGVYLLNLYQDGKFLSAQKLVIIK